VDLRQRCRKSGERPWRPDRNHSPTHRAKPIESDSAPNLHQSHADELMRLIQIAPAVRFSLTPADTDQLRRAGVSEEAIKMMAARQLGLVSPTGTVSVTPGVHQQVRLAASQPPLGAVRQITDAIVVQMVQAKISPDLIILAISELAAVIRHRIFKIGILRSPAQGRGSALG
jgi:hypothetical protein